MFEKDIGALPGGDRKGEGQNYWMGGGGRVLITFKKSHNTVRT